MILVSIIFTLILTLFLVLCFRRNSTYVIQRITLTSMLFVFWLSLFLWIFFDKTSVNYQFHIHDLFSLSGGDVSFLAGTHWGVDGISLFFILLTTGITPMCFLTSWKKKFKNPVEFGLYFLMLELFLILSFTALDILNFFIFFESILIPMFFIVGIWGSRARKIRAAYLLFLYTVFGSILLFFSMLILYLDLGTTAFRVLNYAQLDMNKELFLWLLIFIAFSVKIPMIPFHIWLPEAHVEAPTAGSVILAGLLLKLGGYGFIRILLPIMSTGCAFYLPFVDTLAIISIIYASWTTIRQLDLKRIIAYSSVAHMNVVVLGIFSGTSVGLAGSIYLMIGHGIVSSGLFFLIGVLYDRYETRMLYYYGGLVQTMPVFSIVFLILSFANIGFPGTVNFIGEMLIFVGLADRNFFVIIAAVSGVILSVLYTIYFFNRLAFGSLKTKYMQQYQDLNIRECWILEPILILTIVLGIWPDIILDTINCSVDLVMEQSKIFLLSTTI